MSDPAASMARSNEAPPERPVDWVRPNRLFVLALCLIAAILPLADLDLRPFWDRDFVNYWLGPRAVWAGVNPYELATYRDFGLALFPTANPHQFNFTYPPHAVLLFAPFALLPGTAALVAWNVLSLIAFFYAARPWLPRDFPKLVAAFTPAAIICIQFGQTGLFSSALFLLAFRGSGLAAALLTFKPHLGFLVAPAILLEGRKAILVTLSTTLALVALSLLVGNQWSAFFDHSLNYQGRSLAEQSVIVWILIGTTPMMGYGLWGMVICGVLALIMLCRNFNVFTAATATFLISPYGFNYDMAAVCLGFAILLFAHWDELPAWQKMFATLGYLTPVIAGFGTWWVPPILLIGLYVQAQWFPGVRLSVDNKKLRIVSARP